MCVSSPVGHSEPKRTLLCNCWYVVTWDHELLAETLFERRILRESIRGDVPADLNFIEVAAQRLLRTWEMVSRADVVPA